MWKPWTLGVVLAMKPLAAWATASISEQEQVFAERYGVPVCTFDWRSETLADQAACAGLANAGDLAAKWQLGEFLVREPSTFDAGYTLLKQAANAGFEPAQMSLGLLAYRNLSQAQEAIPWFEKAAKQHNLYAQLFLGRMYMQGIGVARDFSQARHWYLQAAQDHANDTAFYHLGLLARMDAKDYNIERAALMFAQAAEQGHAQSQEELALLYMAIQNWAP